MRGAIDGLTSPFPFGEQLPSVYAEDEMAQRLTGAFDDLFAPLLAVLDCLEAYFSPALAPGDFVAWLGSWVGAELTGEEAEEVLRTTVAESAALHRWRGTARGISEAVRLRFGITPEIVESGGAAWSSRPLGPFPGGPEPHLTIRLPVPRGRTVDRRQVEELVSAIRPAHLPCTIEIVPATTTRGAAGAWTPPAETTPPQKDGSPDE